VENPDQVEVLWRLLAALGLGALIGLEREFRGFEAGIRTLALVSGGAATFGAIGLEYADSRVAQGVAQGIGFLGAGLIFQRRATVHNLTTAATVWATAAIGLLMVEEMGWVALGMAVTTVVVLEMHPMSDWVYRQGDQWASRRAHADPEEEKKSEP
jgi:putative Mg2+ transporter-C (MgtC) family protein